MLREKILRQKLKLDQQTEILNKASLLQMERREAVTVCMANFDDFKAINDRYGYLMIP